MTKSRYYALKSMYRCVVCGKNAADDGYTTCLTCRMDIRARGETHKTESKFRHSEWLKRRRDLLYAFGVCVVCGKRDAETDSHSCNMCNAKARKREAQKRLDKGIMPRIILDGYARCAHCGSTDLVPGHRLCRKHYDTAKNNMLFARSKKSTEPNYFDKSVRAFWNEKRNAAPKDNAPTQVRG